MRIRKAVSGMKRLLTLLLAMALCVPLFAFALPAPVTADAADSLNIYALYLTRAESGAAGEGDAVLLESDGHYLLMDAGMGYYPYVDNESTVRDNDVSDSIMAYLDSLGLDEGAPLDLYVSHLHNDHFGGIYNIIKSGKYNIGHLYVPARAIGNAAADHDFVYWNVLTNERNNYGDAFDGIEVVYLAPDTITCEGEETVSSFTFGNASVDIVGPVRLCTADLLPDGSVDQIENNNSLCAVVTAGSCKYVSMGDALDFEEYDLVEKYAGTDTLRADVFKENHHGYQKSGICTSNNEELLALIRPTYAFCQNYSAQSNVTVPRIIRRYGEAVDIYSEGRAAVFQFETKSDGSVTAKRTFCGHSMDAKTVKVSQISGNMEKHKLTVTCGTCGETVTKEAGHIWDGNGKCIECGFQCPHTYVNDSGETKNNYSSVDRTCLNCRMPCKHEKWWESSHKCQTCYLVCEHKDTTVTSTTKATKTANGKVVKKCNAEYCGHKTTTTIYHPSTYTLSTKTYTYNGKARDPGISIYDTKGSKLVKKTDYTVTSPSGRKNVGKYTYKITFKGNYSGTASLTFTIKPQATTLKSLTPVKGGFKVAWNKQATQTSGYQIMAAADSSFKKDVHTYTYSKTGTTSATIKKNLTAGKKYYVRIRTFKTVTINGKSEKIYSSWSSYKSGKTTK